MRNIIKSELRNVSEMINVLLEEKKQRRKCLILCNSKFDREFVTGRLQNTSLKMIVFGPSQSQEDIDVYLSGKFDVVISSLNLISIGHVLSSIPTFIFYHLRVDNIDYYRGYLNQLLAKLARQEMGYLYLVDSSVTELVNNPNTIETSSLLEASLQALSLLKGEKEFEHDMTLYGPGGMNVVRIERVIKQLEDAIEQVNS